MLPDHSVRQVGGFSLRPFSQKMIQLVVNPSSARPEPQARPGMSVTVPVGHRFCDEGTVEVDAPWFPSRAHH